MITKSNLHFQVFYYKLSSYCRYFHLIWDIRITTGQLRPPTHYLQDTMFNPNGIIPINALIPGLMQHTFINPHIKNSFQLRNLTELKGGKPLAHTTLITLWHFGNVLMPSIHSQNTGIQDLNLTGLKLLGTRLQSICFPLHPTCLERCLLFSRFSRRSVLKWIKRRQTGLEFGTTWESYWMLLQYFLWLICRRLLRQVILARKHVRHHIQYWRRNKGLNLVLVIF